MTGRVLKQKGLYEDDLPLRDKLVHVPVPEPERKRLSKQCRAILERLRHGPASNRELSLIALKYTARISDLRNAGYNVVIHKRSRKTGQVVYALA